MYCPKCGNEIKDGDLFCDKCGMKVDQQEINEKKDGTKNIFKRY